MVSDFVANIIEIPRIIIQQSETIRSGFHDFDLDVKNLNFRPMSEEILVKKLREQENGIDIVLGKGRIIPDSPDNIIVNELMNFPEIDYDVVAELLFRLAGQAVVKLKPVSTMRA
jgi:type III restriction enzyme